MKLALEECEQDNDVDRLLDTLRLAAQAQADWRRWRAGGAGGAGGAGT